MTEADLKCLDELAEDDRVLGRHVRQLTSEVRSLRAEVRRWKQEFRDYAVHDDSRCEYFGKCQCGLAELLEEAKDD